MNRSSLLFDTESSMEQSQTIMFRNDQLMMKKRIPKDSKIDLRKHSSTINEEFSLDDD